MECRLVCNRMFQKLLKNYIFLHSRRYAHPQDCIKIETPDKYSSTLFVPGRSGSDVYQAVKPFIDVDYLASNIKKIRLSYELREIVPQMDIECLIPLIRRWKSTQDEYSDILQKDREYSLELKRLKSLGKECEDFQKEHSKFIDTLKSTKAKLHDIEDEVLPHVRMIPNILDPSTPQLEDIVVSQDSTEMSKLAASHTEIATKATLPIPGTMQLGFSQTSPTAYYLFGQLSEMERALQLYFADRLSSSGFSLIAGTDFCKSFILEATTNDSSDCNIQVGSKSAEKENGQKNILVGGASFETLCAYFVNMNVLESTLPVKYFSHGRSYNSYPKIMSKETPDLFSVVQSTSAHCLSVCKEPDLTHEFEDLFSSIVSCYSPFAIPKRVIDVAARYLNATESRRRLLQLWSPAKRMFVTVAHASQRGDFVSRRLKATYGKEHAVEGYCSMVEGKAVDLPVLIGCILENYQAPDQTFEFKQTLDFLHGFVYD